jgi:cysteine desulfurase
MKRPSIYFDHNATTPLASSVKEMVPHWLESYGNPSSIHWAGRPSKLILREARQTLAKLLGCDPLELIFTSGGSESNNTAIQGTFNSFETGWGWAGAMNRTRNELIISAVEHPSIMKCAEQLARKGFRVHIVPVDPETGVDLDAYEKYLNDKTALVSMMLANNETGMIFPIKKMVEMAHKAGALFHCDAVQGLGKIEFNLRDLNVDFASFSGHKFYALKGSGLLFVKRGLSLESLLPGGGQERGRRAGTENVIGIASFGEMAKRKDEIGSRVRAITELRDYLESQIMKTIDGIGVIGKSLPRLSNTSCLLVKGVDGETLLMNLDVQGFGVSTGAACSSGNPEPSPVLLALGLTRAQAQSSLRISLGWDSNKEEVDLFITAFKHVVDRLRSFGPTAGVVNV